MVLVIVLGVLGVVCLAGCVFSVVSADGGFGWFILAVILFLFAGWRYDSAVVQQDYPKLSAEESCVQTNARPVPAPAALSVAKDDRLGRIYPCLYLLDMGIAPGQPMPLMAGVQEAFFTEASFKATSTMGGWLFLGTGTVHGSSTAEGSTDRVDEYAFMVLTASGAYTKVVVPAEGVQIAVCVDCQPSVTMTTGSEPLYTKKNDVHSDNSIWLHPPSGADPAFPGSVIAATAHVVINLPKDMVPTAVG
jgi:hypothetical protein